MTASSGHAEFCTIPLQLKYVSIIGFPVRPMTAVVSAYSFCMWLLVQETFPVQSPKLCEFQQHLASQCSTVNASCGFHTES